MDLTNKKVLVAGSGVSGIGACRLLAQQKAEIILYDSNISLREEQVRAKLPKDIEVTIALGVLPKEILKMVKLCIISPGIPQDAPFIKEVKELEIPVAGELELASWFVKGRIAAITGTNGKTTTTALAGEIMKSHYDSVFVAGNIGTPLASLALETTEESVSVVEVSSFQLETATAFHPVVSAILNITPDHLDRHGTMEAYTQVKESITKNQTEEDYCILNYDQPVLRAFGTGLSCHVIFFSSHEQLGQGIYLTDNKIVWNDGKKEVLVCKTNELILIGRHNYENVMAAVAVGISMGVPMESIRKTIKTFKAVEHRIEFVAEKNGVIFYNDSKGTNPDAAIKAVEAMDRPTLLIAGGYDKDSEYDEWILSFNNKVRYMVLIGQTRDKIAETARRLGFMDVIYAEDMDEAVKVCSAYANSGDAVLLSPACASWGMFDNYEQRGNVFKECVNNL